MTFFHWIIPSLVIIKKSFILLNLRLRTQQSLLTQLHIWIYNSNLTFKENWTWNSMTSVMISISLLSIFLFLAVTFLHLLLMAYMFHNLYVMQGLPQNTGAFCTGENCLLINYWHRDIASQDSSKQLRSFMVVIMRLLTNLVFLCPKWYWTFLRPNSFKFGFPLPIFNIHVTGVSTEPGGAYSSGAPGLTSISEVHVFPQFCNISSIVW